MSEEIILNHRSGGQLKTYQFPTEASMILTAADCFRAPDFWAAWSQSYLESQVNSTACFSQHTQDGHQGNDPRILFWPVAIFTSELTWLDITTVSC